MKQYVGSRRVLSELLRLTDLNGPTVCDVSHLPVFVCLIVITMVELYLLTRITSVILIYFLENAILFYTITKEYCFQ